MLQLCAHRPIEKTRHDVPHGEHVWEVDVYGGRHEGLIVAEVELDEEREPVDFPDWIGQEVTGDPRFSNVVLAESDIPDR
jgi:CYTH domain-containing protein